MSTHLANKSPNGIATSPRVGRDPDGMVDNRPGVSHPEMPRHNQAKSPANSREAPDLFCRDPHLGREVVNHSQKTCAERKDGKWVVGIGMRNPSRAQRKPVRKKRGKRGELTEATQENTGAFNAIQPDQSSYEPDSR